MSFGALFIPTLLPLVLHSVGIVLLMLFERVPWKRAAQAAVRAHGLTIVDNARVFALLNIAAHDMRVVGSSTSDRPNVCR